MRNANVVGSGYGNDDGSARWRRLVWVSGSVALGLLAMGCGSDSAASGDSPAGSQGKSVAERKAEWQSKCHKQDPDAKAEYEEFVGWVNRVRAFNCPIYNAACPDRETPADCDEFHTYYDEGLECGLATFDVAAADACLDGAAAGAYVDCSAMTFSVGQLGEGDACAYLDSGCGPGLLCAVPGGSFEDYGVCIPAKGLGDSCTRHAECVSGDCEASQCVALEVRPINCAFPFN